MTFLRVWYINSDLFCGGASLSSDMNFGVFLTEKGDIFTSRTVGNVNHYNINNVCGVVVPQYLRFSVYSTK